jgi:AAA+ superfamily predicted ATPase
MPQTSKNTGYEYGYDVSDNDENEDFTSNKKLWAVNGSSFYSSYPTVKELPAGQYTVCYEHSVGYYFEKSDLKTDDIFIMEDSVTDDVMAAMQTFWSKENKYREFGFLWKRGILLYGPPGTGKTCTVQLLAQEVEKLGGISIYIDNPGYFDGLKVLRKIEPNKPLVIILEDIDSIIEQHGESDVLSILDGEMQLDNVVFVATTNYIDKLPGRLKNRPSRFDIIRKINFPSASNRRSYLLAKNPKRFEVTGTNDGLKNLNDWVEQTDQFSVAHLKELIISVECLDVPFEVAVKRIRALIDAERQNDMDSIEDAFQ